MNYFSHKEVDEEQLRDIINELYNYNIFDFISRVSALNLLPYNQNKSIIFDTLINAILEHKRDDFNGTSIMSSKKFTKIISRGMELQVALRIDPAEMPYIYQVQFYGNHWIFSGINTNCGFILQNFLNVIFKLDNKLNLDYVCKCRDMATFILNTSTKIATNLGYDMDTLGHYSNKNIIFTDSSSMQILINSITINFSNLCDLLPQEDIDILFANFETKSISSDYNFNNYDFFYHPFLKIDDVHAVVLNPSMLSTFLIHYFLKTAKEYNIYNEVIRLYNSYVFNYCRQTLDSLGHKKIDETLLDIELSNSENYKELLLNVCNDGVLYVRFFCDDGIDYEPKNMFALHTINTCEIEKRWEYISSKLEKCAAHRIYQIILINTFGRGISFGFQQEQCSKSLVLSPFELMCVGINERLHKNFISRYVDSKMFCAEPVVDYDSDIYRIALYSKNNYSFYMNDEFDLRTGRLFIGYGDSVDYINEALKKENRQLISFPNDSFLREIVINDNIRNIYCSTTLPPIELLNRYLSVDIWITTPLPSSTEFFNISYSVIDLVTYWLGEMQDTIEKHSFIYDSIEIKMIFEGEAQDYYLENNRNDLPLNNYISINKVENVLYVYWQPESFVNLEGKHNYREKELLLLLLDALSDYSLTPFDKGEINCIFANPLKKKMFSLDYQTHPYIKPIDLDVRKIPVECEDELLNEIGYYFIKEKGLRDSNFDDEMKVNICNDAVSYLYNKLCTVVQQLNSLNLYELVYYDLEKIMYAMMLKQKRFALDVSCYPEKEKELIKETSELNKSSLALKFLIEYISAQPPKGNVILGELDYEYILSICSAIIDWANSSDLFKYKIINSDMGILESGRIGIDKSQIERIAFLNSSANEKRLNNNSNPFVQKFSQENLLSNTPEEIDEAFLDEFGYKFSEFTCCVFEMLNIGDESASDVKRMKRKMICETIAKNLNFEESTVSKILEDLSLSEREDYIKPPKGYKNIDIWPWRFNRRLSFTRRPIICIDGDLLWGNRQLYHCLLFTIDLICNDKLPVKEKGKLKVLMSQLSNYNGNSFNDVVAKRIKDIGLFIVDSKVKKINGKHISSEENNTFGDIDVLVINPKKKKIIVVEVKNFNFSKTPYEMHQEYLKIFCDYGDKLCYISKHKRRVKWIKEHIDDVLVHYKLSGKNWKVDDLLIVNEDIISSEYYHQKQKIMLYSDIDKKAISNI